jgi:hypothetical protein
MGIPLGWLVPSFSTARAPPCMARKLIPPKKYSAGRRNFLFMDLINIALTPITQK